MEPKDEPLSAEEIIKSQPDPESEEWPEEPPHDRPEEDND